MTSGGSAELLLSERFDRFRWTQACVVFNPKHLLGAKVGSDIRDPKTNDLIVKEGKKYTRPVLRQMESAQDQAGADRLGRNSRPHCLARYY